MLGWTWGRTGCALCDMLAPTERAVTFHSRCCPHAAGWHPLDAGQQRCMRLPASRAPDLWSAASRGIRGAFAPRMKVCDSPLEPAFQPLSCPSMPRSALSYARLSAHSALAGRQVRAHAGPVGAAVGSDA